MVEADAVLAELLVGRRGAVLVQSEQGATGQEVHGVVHVWVGVLVEDRLGAEERLVPGHAHRQVLHGERHMGETGERRHGNLLRFLLSALSPPQRRSVAPGVLGGAYCDGLLSPRHEHGVADFQARVRKARAAG